MEGVRVVWFSVIAGCLSFEVTLGNTSVSQGQTSARLLMAESLVELLLLPDANVATWSPSDDWLVRRFSEGLLEELLRSLLLDIRFSSSLSLALSLEEQDPFLFEQESLLFE